MRATLAVSAWMVSLLSCYSYTSNTLPDIENEDFIKDCVRIHNKFRSEVKPTASNMLYMTWDPTLAKVAKAWGGKCTLGHNGQLHSPYKLHPNFSVLGENIWSGSVSMFSVSSAITSWYDEIQYYYFKTRECRNVCGHYTQVAWADSYKVGCAVQFCPRVAGFGALSNGAHYVCNYGPAGNYPTAPYKKGSTCSACQKEDMCLDKLCANQKRDGTSYYYSLKYPGWRIYIRNRYISLVLILLSIILILTFVIVVVCKHYFNK